MGKRITVVQHYIRFILLLFPAMFSTVGAALLVGHQQQLPPQFDIYHMRDCMLPCWIQIIPGETTIGEAQTLLESTYPSSEYEHALSYSSYSDVNWLRITQRKYGVYLLVGFNAGERPNDQTQDTIITQLTILDGSDTELTLGEWINVLGEPQALSIAWGNHQAYPTALYYRQGVELTLFNQADNFAVDNPYLSAVSLDIYADIDSLHHPSHTVLWHGFDTAYKDQLLALMLP